jgi:perosamine synthetase
VNKKILHSVPTIGEDDISSVEAVLRSLHLEEGDCVRQFEKKYSELVNKKFSHATINGFSSIHLSLIASNIRKGDEVILPSYTCAALLNPIKIIGAIPVFADIGNNSFNLSAETIEKVVTKKTKLVILPHIFGFPAEMEKILKIGIPVIEDTAQSDGGKYSGKRLGSFTNISVTSFYATKMITCGDGGMISTNDPEASERIKNFIYYGAKRNHKYDSLNYHMTNLPAALGLSQLNKIDNFIRKRKELANVYNNIFEGRTEVEINFNNKNESCYYRYPILVNNRDALKTKLLEKGIHTGYGVLEGLHLLTDQDGSIYKNTNNFLNNILCLPIYPSLEKSQAEFIGETVISLLKS